MLIVADGVVKGGCVECSIGSDRWVAHQACPVTGAPGVRQVVGEISSVRLEVVGVDAGYCPRSSKVQPLALRGRDVRTGPSDGSARG